MVDKNTRKRQRMQNRRLEMRYVAGCTPTSWRRYIVAGATICYSIQALAHRSNNNPTEGDDSHDSTR